MALAEDGVGEQAVLGPLLRRAADEREAREERGSLGRGGFGRGVRGGRVDREGEDREDELGGEAGGVGWPAGGSSLARE